MKLPRKRRNGPNTAPMVTPPRHPDRWHASCFINLALFTGRSCAITRAEIERQGLDCVPEKEARRRPLGRRRFFWSACVAFPDLDKIWRPAVSGTGGIQDDRVAGRQKP